jgi:hypothetical protein
MSLPRLPFVVLMVTVAAGVSAPSAQISSLASEAAPAAPLIERFLTRQDLPLTSYRALRRLSARNGRFKLEGWLEVETTLSGKNELSWTVVAEGGSGTIRNKVLRKALDGEAETLAKGLGPRGALTRDNYEFALGTAGRLDLRPKRKDTLLLTGFALLSEADADLLEINGRLTRNPSFWTRNVDVRRRYARVNGVRVPVAMESTAQVRFAGTSHFEMTYRYLEVNGTPTDDSSRPGLSQRFD